MTQDRWNTSIQRAGSTVSTPLAKRYGTEKGVTTGCPRLKELGAELLLIRAFKAGKLTWPEMRRGYLAGLEKPVAQAQLRELKALVRRGRVTLLCACPDESRCHRGLLKRVRSAS